MSHQLALLAMAERTRLFPLLLGDACPTGATCGRCELEQRWGRGRIDLAMDLGQARRLYVEVKVHGRGGGASAGHPLATHDRTKDDTFRMRADCGPQLRRYIHEASIRPNTILLFLLLGRSAQNLAPEIERRRKDPKLEGRCLVKTASDLLTALASPELHAGYEQHPEHALAREIASGYRLALSGLAVP